MKLTKRKGFNFFRSYYDVYNELDNAADKVAFIDALFDRQFLGAKPTNLTGMAKFAYISQTNSIDSQVKGYEDKTKTRLDGSPYNKEVSPPTVPPKQGGYTPPTVQVEEKEEVKEEQQDVLSLKEKYTETEFIERWRNARDYYLKLPYYKTKLEPLDKRNLDIISESYSKNQIDNAIKGLFLQKDAVKHLVLQPSHFLVLKNFEMYLTCSVSGEQIYEKKTFKKPIERI